MKDKKEREEGVSPIIGEMLMLSIVLILVSLFAVSVSQYVPEDREPSLNVMMGDIVDSGCNLTLWHKGGDTVSKRDIKVIFTNSTSRLVRYSDDMVIGDNTSNNFMPGDFLKINTSGQHVAGSTVQMVVSKSVVFVGKVEGEE